MTFITSRLREPSTAAGIAALLAIVGVRLSPEAYTAVVELIGAGFAVLAILLREKR